MKTATSILVCLLALGALVIGALELSRYRNREASRRAVAQAVDLAHGEVLRTGTLTKDALTDIQCTVNRSLGSERCSVQLDVISTNPFVFRIQAITPWPDLTVYEFDSRTPGRGIYSYSY
jgi:hypothetical protein